MFHRRKRCRRCKDALDVRLRRLFGAVTRGWSSGWRCRPEDMHGLPRVGAALASIHARLVAHRGFAGFARSSRLPACDWLVGGSTPFVVELDESQHFTLPRELALAAYPTSVALGFDATRWRAECARVHARDNTPVDRDETRAWYDSLRDLLPCEHGFGPTVRLLDGDYVWCADAVSDEQLDAILAGAPGRNPAPIRRSRGPGA